jgi:hypothetical protein
MQWSEVKGIEGGEKYLIIQWSEVKW